MIGESLYDDVYRDARADREHDPPDPERPDRDEYDSPPEEYSTESICGQCRALLSNSTQVCQQPAGGLCEVMRRRRERWTGP
jgi:hypothetical protein